MIIGYYWPSSLNISTAVLSSLSVLLVVLYRYFHQPLKSRIKQVGLKIPGPWGLPVVGHLFRLGPQPHLKLTEWARKHGSVYQIRLGGRPAVVISGSDLIASTLVTKGVEVAGRPDFASFRIINDGVNMTFTSYGPLWTIKRSLIHKAIVSYMAKSGSSMDELVHRETDKLIASLLEGKTMEGELGKLFLKHSSSFVQKMCFSMNEETEESKDKVTDEIIGLFEKITKVSLIVSILDIFPSLDWLFPKQVDMFRKLNKILIDMVEKQQSCNVATYVSGEVRDLTDGMIQAIGQAKESDLDQLGWTRAEIMRLMVDLLGAGQNTIASNLRWLCLYMILHPDIQSKVHDEIRQVLGSRRPTKEDEKSMPYTSAVIIESRRHSVMFPVLVPHSTVCQTEIAGHKIPVDTILLFNMWSASRDPSVWSEPDRFLPERFLDPETGLVDVDKKQTFLAFGAGRRRCIGERIGNSAVFIFFAGLMQRLWLLPAPDHCYTLKGDFGFVFDTAPYSARVVPVEV